MKKSPKKNVLIFALIASMVFLQPQYTIQAEAAARKTDVSKASKGCELVGVKGSYENVAKSKILKRINAIRKEACQKGYINPATGKKLTIKNYVPIKWSSDLEWIAQIRAAEASIYESHTRPNGKSCFSISRKGSQSWAENLAWNYSGLMQGIEQWYSEKNDWVRQNSSAVTGHYTSMINPEYTYIGLGSFRRTSGGFQSVAAEFSFVDKMNETKSTLKGNKTQIIEVRSKNLSSDKIQAPSSIKIKKTKTVYIGKKITFPGIMGGKNVTNAISQKSVKWTSSNKSRLTINSKGVIKAKKAGKVTIKAKIGKKTIKKSITVKK